MLNATASSEIWEKKVSVKKKTTILSFFPASCYPLEHLRGNKINIKLNTRINIWGQNTGSTQSC